MTTEVLQGIYANLTAQDIYDANQQMFEGIGEAGGVGFGVGFLLNAMGANAKILRKQGREEEAQVVENQMAQFESQAAKGGVSSYKMGGVKIESPEIINNMIDNMTATDLVKANIEIENDPELNDRLQNKIVTSSIKEQVRQGNPDLDETSLDAITNLELELRKLEGNTTQTGKDKAASIRSQIKTIQENVQEQTAGEVPVQSGAEGGREVAEGEPQAGPQVTTEEGVQAEVVTPQEEVVPAPPEMTERDEDNEIVRLGDKVFQAKKNIARADDTEAAIEEYNAAKKELDDFEASVQQRKDKKRAQSNIESIIEDEKTDSQRAGYEYKYADLSEYLNTIRGPLSECGLALVQVIEIKDEHPDQEFLVTMIIHESGEWIKSTFNLKSQAVLSKDGRNRINDMQSLGSGISYLRRYAIAAICGLGQEDDDGARSKHNAQKKQQEGPNYGKMLVDLCVHNGIEAAAFAKRFHLSSSDPEGIKKAIAGFLDLKNEFLGQLGQTIKT
jgi:hypothetical protein